MNFQEFLEEEKEIKREYERKLYLLSRRYAIQKLGYHKGDIISNNSYTIKIEKIIVSRNLEGEPWCTYHGTIIGTNKKGFIHSINIFNDGRKK